MPNCRGTQWSSESYESERFPQLTKEHGADPYLRAPHIIAITAKPLYLTSNTAAEGMGLRRGHLRE